MERRGEAPLLRTRKQLTRELTSHVQRIQRTLEGANIKLDSVISDVVGTSGRAMIEALIAGETDPAKRAAFANRRIKVGPDALRLHLQQIDALDQAIAEIDKEVEATSIPFAPLSTC
jgi:transposase